MPITISGGVQLSGGIPYTSGIDQFPFSSDSNASSVGNLTLARAEHSGFQG